MTCVLLCSKLKIISAPNVPIGCCRHSVERLLDSVDAVVYVLDYTKLKTKEEAELLTRLSESNPQLIQRLAQRLFFVVNKVDEMHTSEGLNADELREYVAELVTRTMNIASFQLKPDQVTILRKVPRQTFSPSTFSSSTLKQET